MSEHNHHTYHEPPQSLLQQSGEKALSRGRQYRKSRTREIAEVHREREAQSGDEKRVSEAAQKAQRESFKSDSELRRKSDGGREKLQAEKKSVEARKREIEE